jgi:predicted  nucleic acid-binding Zn-ribbon protein
LKDANARIQQLLHTASANEPATAYLNDQLEAVNNAKADAERLKEKLIEAETRIHEMDKDYSKVVADLEAKQR